MKTPLEAIDEAIASLQSVREILATDSVPDYPFTGTTGLLSLHFYRPVERAGETDDSKALARSISSKWKKEENCWTTQIAGVELFIHNAEPARNPQPETVEL